MFSEKDSRWIF
jgi:hypothetical protein